jgi:cellobiose phosphorylase
MLNPTTHSHTPQAVSVYRVEPYVMAADVYATPPHVGHGGWTWYTGSASWMYRLMTESLLGLHLEVDQLSFKPIQHPEWSSWRVRYRFRSTWYHITFSVAERHTVAVDGEDQPGLHVRLSDDGRDHEVVVTCPKP